MIEISNNAFLNRPVSSQFSLDDWHDVFDPALRDVSVLWRVEVRGLGPFQMRLINVTVGVSDGGHQNGVRNLEYVKKRDNLWSEPLEQHLGGVIEKDLSAFLEVA